MQYNYSKPYDEEILERLHGVQLQILGDLDRVCRKYGIKYFALYGTAIGAVRHGGFIPWDDDIDVGMLREDYDKFIDIFNKELDGYYELITPYKDSDYTCTVTHLQKKGTKFVSQFYRRAKYNLGIFIDIFPLDKVAPNITGRRKQAFITTFLGRLLFLCGTPYPNIPINGMKGKLAAAICFLTHYVLKIFRISGTTVYKRFDRASRKYNKCNSKFVTSFEYSGSIKDMVPISELFPLREVPFETGTVYLPANNDKFLKRIYGDYMKIPPKCKQINHCPYLIQFEGEKPIINK